MTTPPKRLITFEVPGNIVPFARAGGGKTMHRFTPRKQADYMVAVRTICAAAMHGAPPIEGPVQLGIIAEYMHPDSWSAKKKAATQYKTSKPDIGNIEKLVEDALNKIAWLDDSQIAQRGQTMKIYTNRFHLTVNILEL